jgi:hypothetical protein
MVPRTFRISRLNFGFAGCQNGVGTYTSDSHSPPKLDANNLKIILENRPYVCDFKDAFSGLSPHGALLKGESRLIHQSEVIARLE